MKTFSRLLCMLAALWATSAPAATHTVRAQGLSFVPNDVTIAVGDTVMFTGGDNFHTVTGDTAAEPFCGNGLYTTCNVTFEQAGTFNYHCIPHVSAGMVGVVRVLSGVTTPLTVQIQGQGTVTPDLNGQDLLVGNTYVITATPAPGFVFSGWTGGLTASAARLSFVMQPNLVLQANFVANPFPLKNRMYNGLFFVDDGNGVQHESSGSFSFVLTKTGKYSGNLQLAGKRSGFSGQFGQDGTATNMVKRAGGNVLTMELSLAGDGNAGQVEGRVLNPGAGWVAPLQGDVAPVFVGTDSSPYRGQYTLVMDSELPDFGDGFGTVKVDPKGKLRFTGTLADSSPVSQSVPVSASGLWPLYVPLYGGKGSVLSWVTVSTEPAPAASLQGEMSWSKPRLPGRVYPDGFTNELDLVGSIYQPPLASPVLPLDTGVVTFEGGNLTTVYTNIVTLGPKNQVTSLGTNPLVMKIALPTGLFSGTVKLNDAGQNKKLSFKGAILQRQNLGSGFFLSTNQSGSVQLVPLP